MKITNEDNMELMARYSDNYFDLSIVDPPYGSNALDGSKISKKFKINRSKNWDCYRPKKSYFNELFRISKNQIIWGGNYFINDLNDTKCCIVLDKSNIPDKFKTMSPIELAWTSFNKPSKIFRTSTNTGNKIHPTQKPIKLYEWLLINYAKEGDKILDTHLGSGSIAIACHNLGYNLTACELDKDYYNAAIKRIEQHKAQQRLF